jgi:hypothetical protein
MKLLTIAALGEALTGLALLAYPPIVVRVLFGSEISGAGMVMSRIAGLGLIGLGVACWPSRTGLQSLYGMLTYSVLVMLYLLRIGIRGAPLGPLLWPAVVVHAALSVLLLWICLRPANSPRGNR